MGRITTAVLSLFCCVVLSAQEKSCVFEQSYLKALSETRVASGKYFEPDSSCFSDSKALLKSSHRFVIDYRKPVDFAKGSLPGALNLSLGQMSSNEAIKSRPLTLVAESYSSYLLADVCRQLKVVGFNDVQVYFPGLRDLEAHLIKNQGYSHRQRYLASMDQAYKEVLYGGGEFISFSDVSPFLVKEMNTLIKLYEDPFNQKLNAEKKYFFILEEDSLSTHRRIKANSNFFLVREDVEELESWVIRNKRYLEAYKSVSKRYSCS